MKEKKYQVFISSTYADLTEERKKVLDVLLMADCIPAGMEAFVATDVEQFEVIKKVIDLCDYYVLILGKRYGSIHPETGISYTEMEYDYAIEHDIPVLVFAIDESVEVSENKQEQDVIKAGKLKEFRLKAMNNRLASIWKTPEDLTGKLAISIMKAKSEIARPGWQRATEYDEVSLRREIMELQKKCDELETSLKEERKKVDAFTEQTDVAFEDCEVELEYHYQRNSATLHGSKTVTLVDLFITVSVELMDVAMREHGIASAIKNKFLASYFLADFDDKQFVKKILNQFKVLGLVCSYWSKDKSSLYWSLTEKGSKMRDDMTLIRKS